MKADNTYYVITASRLVQGDVVYLTREAGTIGWSTDIKQAYVLRASVVERMLRLAEKDVTANKVIAPYAIEITGKCQPLGARETIRAAH